MLTPMKSGTTTIRRLWRRLALLALASAVASVVAASGAAAGEGEVVVPALSPAAQDGKAAFDTHCAECHGANAAGTDKGPTFLHRVYHPGHHADFSFVLAVTRGVRQHHWRFGNMKRLPEVDEAMVERIVRYVRELQQANGIF